MLTDDEGSVNEGKLHEGNAVAEEKVDGCLPTKRDEGDLHEGKNAAKGRAGGRNDAYRRRRKSARRKQCRRKERNRERCEVLTIDEGDMRNGMYEKNWRRRAEKVVRNRRAKIWRRNCRS